MTAITAVHVTNWPTEEVKPDHTVLRDNFFVVVYLGTGKVLAHFLKSNDIAQIEKLADTVRAKAKTEADLTPDCWKDFSDDCVYSEASMQAAYEHEQLERWSVVA